MNTLKIFCWALVLFVAQNVTAKTVKYVEVGVNRSTFRHESCTPGYGISGGLGLDYYPFSKFGGFVGSGLKLQNIRISLKDRIWEANLNQMDNYFKKGDININLLFVEIPLQIGITKKISNQTSLEFHCGYNLMIPLSNNNKINKSRVIKLEPNDQGEYDYDYERVDGRVEGFENLFFGGKIVYKSYFFSLSIEKAIDARQSSDTIRIYDEIEGYLFNIGYNF